MDIIDDGDSDFEFHDHLDFSNISSYNWFDEYDTRPFWEPSTILYFIILTLGFSIGVFGNCFVMFIIPKFSELRTVPNYILWNLALMDLIFLANVPLDLVTLLAETWVFSLFLCKIFFSVFQLKALGTSLLLIAMAIERITTFHCPHRPLFRQPLFWILVVHIIWILSVGFGLPLFFAAKKYEIQEDVYCYANSSVLVYTLFLIIVTSIALGISCGLLVRVMSQLHKDPVTRGRIFPEKIYLVLSLIASHLICWIVYYAINIPTTIFGSDLNYDILLTISECLLEINSAVSPVLILCLSPDLKRSAAKLLGMTRNLGEEIEHVPLA